MPPLRLLVRVDATHEVGIAHAVRTSKLVAMLKARPALMVMGRDDGLLAEFFPDARRVAPADGGRFGGPVDAVLVDYPGTPPAFWHHWRRERGVPVIAIDDYGCAIDADLIINGTALDTYHRYDGLPAGAVVLAGADYALIDPCFAATPWRGGGPGRRVAVVVGSGRGAAEWALELLSGGCDFGAWGAVEMIVGHGFPKFAELAERAAEKHVAVRKGVASAELAHSLAAASGALTTGGMIVYECLAVGVPSVVFPQERNLVAEAECFAGKGCVVDLGYDGGMDIKAVDAAVADLLGDAERATQQSRAGRVLVDGRGMGRAAAAVDALLSKVPAATAH